MSHDKQIQGIKLRFSEGESEITCAHCLRSFMVRSDYLNYVDQCPFCGGVVDIAS